MTGATLSHYKVLEKLGEGGMGVVYKASDLKLSRTVALKFLRSHLRSDDAGRARFLQEAQAAAALNHPNICTIYEIDEIDGTLFIAMELCSGQPLSNLVHSRPLELVEALHLGLQITDAVAKAHQVEVVHRDIKSSNIIVDQAGRAKLLDFGLASLRVDDRTVTRGSMGTPQYMAPERFEAGIADKRGDIWSLGVLLYELITGRMPFSGSVTQLVNTILNEDPLPASVMRSEVPAELDDVIAKAIAKDPIERYESAEQMLGDLAVVATRLLGQQSSGSKSNGALPFAPLTVMGRSAEPHRIYGLAVLPFLNMSSDPDSAYLCDGLTEDLINALTQVKGIRVVARASTFRFRSDSLDLREIGRRLRVGAFVLGSVRRSGSRLRVTAQLVKSADGYQIWSKRFDTEVHDIFQVQDDLTAAIVENLRDLLGADPGHVPSAEHTSNFEAHELYLRGRYSFNQQTEVAFHEALQNFRKASQLAPSYALAHVAIADCFAVMGWHGMLPSHEAMPQAKEAAQAALRINPSLASAYCVLGSIYAGFDWNWMQARAAFQKAFSLPPPTSDLHFHHSLDFLTPLGRLDEAHEEIKCALDLDPVSPLVNTALGGCLYRKRLYNAALRQLNATLELDPNFYHSFWTRARVLQARGELGEALRGYMHAYTASGNSAAVLSEMGHCHAIMGDAAAARDTLGKLQDISAHTHVSPLAFATVYHGLGERSVFLEYLLKAVEERTRGLVWLWVDPRFEDMHEDADFAATLAPLGLGSAATPAKSSR
ncbi:MAG: protein kinase [Acidobacteriaceae bacterium]|nr:protein kinase [Acidobacteriaceae bacterium]